MWIGRIGFQNLIIFKKLNHDHAAPFGIVLKTWPLRFLRVVYHPLDAIVKLCTMIELMKWLSLSNPNSGRGPKILKDCHVTLIAFIYLGVLYLPLDSNVSRLFGWQIVWPAATATSSVHHSLTMNSTTAGHVSESHCGTLKSGGSLSKYTVSMVACGHFITFLS